jgi:hypothetical protein
MAPHFSKLSSVLAGIGFYLLIFGLVLLVTWGYWPTSNWGWVALFVLGPPVYLAVEIFGEALFGKILPLDVWLGDFSSPVRILVVAGVLGALYVGGLALWVFLKT